MAGERSRDQIAPLDALVVRRGGCGGAGDVVAGQELEQGKATCPRPEHAGSRVRFDGRHGPPGHRRQRYRCIADNGDPPHRFTETLPREESWTDDCELCERDVGFHEGPHAARKYQFVARGIAEALQLVGVDFTYREAALVARERAERLRVDPGTPSRWRSGSRLRRRR